MMKVQLIPLVVGLLLLGMTQASAQQNLYRWVDEEGVVHYGDHVPPAYSDQEHEILNDRGVALRRVEGTASEDELAERARLETLKKAEAEAAREGARRDKVLLDTYLSVEEIVRLRDQRLELIEAQITVTEQYLTTLIERLMELQHTVSQYKPYSQDPDARTMPTFLELDLARTMSSVDVYEDTLRRTRDQRTKMSEDFARDIQRFQELAGS